MPGILIDHGQERLVRANIQFYRDDHGPTDLDPDERNLDLCPVNTRNADD